jgi:hypothetical protein
MNRVRCGSCLEPQSAHRPDCEDANAPKVESFDAKFDEMLEIARKALNYKLQPEDVKEN